MASEAAGVGSATAAVSLLVRLGLGARRCSAALLLLGPLLLGLLGLGETSAPLLGERGVVVGAQVGVDDPRVAP